MHHTRIRPAIQTFLLLSALAPSALTAACQSSASTSKTAAPAVTVTADTWAVVDGQQITRADVDKAFARTHDPAAPAPSDEETLVAKMSILNDLIVQEILTGKARAQKLEVPQTEVDAAFADAKKNIPDDAFQQELTKRGMTVAEMQDSLRRELITQKVIAQEVGSKVVVSDQDITAFFNANRAQFNIAVERSAATGTGASL